MTVVYYKDKNQAETQQWWSLCAEIRNLNFILSTGGFLTSCQKMACFSNVLKYILDQPRVSKERNHAQVEDPTRLTQGALNITWTSGSKSSSLNSASRVVEIVSKDVKAIQHAKVKGEFSSIQCSSHFENVNTLLNSIRKIPLYKQKLN